MGLHSFWRAGLVDEALSREICLGMFLVGWSGFEF